VLRKQSEEVERDLKTELRQSLAKENSLSQMLEKTKNSLDKEKNYANQTKSRLDQTCESLAKAENELRTT